MQTSSSHRPVIGPLALLARPRTERWLDGVWEVADWQTSIATDAVSDGLQVFFVVEGLTMMMMMMVIVMMTTTTTMMMLTMTTTMKTDSLRDKFFHQSIESISKRTSLK